MQVRFHRSIRLAPGLRLNLGMRGAGISVGPHGAHVGWSTRHGQYASAGIPGTGLYALHYVNGKAKRVTHGVPVWIILLAALGAATHCGR